jgi:hypothetical protein
LAEDDATSVDEWVRTTLTADDCVYLYKRKNEVNEACPQVPKEHFLLVYQNKFQREQLVRINRMLFMDGTHNIDIYGHQLFTIIAQDEFGHGVPVCSIITSAGKIDILEAALSAFKQRFEEHIKVELPYPKCGHDPLQHGIQCECVLNFKPHYFMIDDDKAEQAAIGRVFPNSQQLLCHWHVNVNWWRSCQSLLVGTLRFEVFGILKRLIRAKLFVRYNELLIELQERCDGDGLLFWTYFENNYMGSGRPGNKAFLLFVLFLNL